MKHDSPNNGNFRQPILPPQTVIKNKQKLKHLLYTMTDSDILLLILGMALGYCICKIKTLIEEQK